VFDTAKIIISGTFPGLKHFKSCFASSPDCAALQDVVYASPAYLMIRRLFVSFRYWPEEPDHLSDSIQTYVAVHDAVEALDGDGSLYVRTKTGKQEQARQKTIFHMIRFARTLLHSHRVHPARRRIVGSTMRLQSSCQQMPSIVPSRPASSRHIPTEML
jgi:hypothetical protein